MPVGDLSPDNASADIARTRDAELVRSSSSFTRRDGTAVAIDWVTMQNTRGRAAVHGQPRLADKLASAA